MLTESETTVTEQEHAETTMVHAAGDLFGPPPPVHSMTTCNDGGGEDKATATTAISVRDSAAGGLVQMFGLDPRVAIFLVIVDLLLFSGDIVSLGTLVPLGVVVGAAVGFITYRAQRHWFRDDHESALIKGMMVAVLTAIPVPITPLVAIPGGVLGLIHKLRKK